MSTAPARKETPAKAPKAAKTASAKPAKRTPKAVKSAPSKPVSAAAPRPKHTESRLSQVLVEPIVSEKATLVSEKQNQVTFKVLRDATKPEIKAAVELMFKVDVESVQTVVQKGKVKKFGRSIGRRDHIKKAYVSLKAGQELNFSGEGA
jgi:large subunit ribosomal protein L23